MSAFWSALVDFRFVTCAIEAGVMNLEYLWGGLLCAENPKRQEE